ncbi:MAG: MopE-related protein, partial [Myxococcota bacterium]
CGEARPDGVIPYGPDYEAVGESQESCDGLDNNCNGAADQSEMCVMMECDPDNPRACSTDIGICTVGERECNDGVIGECVDPETRVPVIMQGDVEETCNGLDDDCDGIVDNEPNSGRPGTICPDDCPFGMALVINPSGTPGNDRWCIDRYEASRTDATATDAGVETIRSVSRPGVLPWTGLTIEDAQSACRGPQGVQFPRKRLCQLREITFTCSGVNENTFPYGNVYDGAICNGADAGVVSVTPTGPTEDMGDNDFAECN